MSKNLAFGYRAHALLLAAAATLWAHDAAGQLKLSGTTVTPHVIVETMRYAHDPEPADGARVQLLLLNDGAQPLVLDGDSSLRCDGKTPAELIAGGEWAWHDCPGAVPSEVVTLPPGAMTVWTFNGRRKPYGAAGTTQLRIGPANTPWFNDTLTLAAPTMWISAVTFTAGDAELYPNRMIVHVANQSAHSATLQSCRVWLPQDGKAPRALLAQAPLTIAPFNGYAEIPAGDRGGFIAETPPLPLTYCAVEVGVKVNGADTTLWAHLRIKPERFDISGGWVNGGNRLTHEVFLKTLKRLHVNTAHIAHTPGYSDTPLYERYPLKYFNALTPFEMYDTDAMLPRIHAVEFLGEPQYGGRRPVPPQEVWEKLAPYRVTRLATTVTHSEERIWRDYAGLSDYPHYDAYRVTAPSADAWRKYERWGEVRIGWGAPLETIGDMCRSLRELNRPMPCAIWSQGPHEGWDVYGGRKRTTPTPDEIRVQAYHAISTRITSLYWFNLSLKSLVQWRDTLPELERIGRELRMLDELLLEGDAYAFERNTRRGKRPDWDVASIAGPHAALLFALDLDYAPDPDQRVFVFGPPRAAEWSFRIPAYLSGVADVFRVDADGVHDVHWREKRGRIIIRDTQSRVAVYIASRYPDRRAAMENERQRLLAEENSLGFDPARNDQDYAALSELADY